MLCRESTERFMMVVIGIAICGVFSLIGCDDENSTAQTDAGDTADADTESGGSDSVETDTGNDAPGTCIASIVGEVKTSTGEQWAEGKLAICVPMCIRLETDKEGKFSTPVGTGGATCKKFDFDGAVAPFHLTIYDATGTYAAWGAAYSPTQEQVSDKGEDDYEYDLGTLVLYELPEEKADYTAASGASVDLSGVSFELPANSLLGTKDFVEVFPETAEIKVFKAPLDTWQPPFDNVGFDALYFIAPRWAKLAGEGVPLSIEPPAGWSEGDKGTLYILADDVPGLGEMNEYITKSESGVCFTSTDILEKEPGGEVAICGTAEVVDGRVVTSPIPRLSWVGLKK